jgi:hypothetical protein
MGYCVKVGGWFADRIRFEDSIYKKAYVIKKMKK